MLYVVGGMIVGIVLALVITAVMNLLSKRDAELDFIVGSIETLARQREEAHHNGRSR